MAWLLLYVQPQTETERNLMDKPIQGRKRDGNEPEPGFMTEKREGFKKFGKQFITTNRLQVCIIWVKIKYMKFD